MFDVRKDFPIFRNCPHLCYLDSAATSQKPDAVIQAVTTFLAFDNANVRRGLHRLNDQAEEAYQYARRRVAEFIGAKPREIIFTQNATASLNIVARGFAPQRPGGVMVTHQEHNSNLLPWFAYPPTHFFNPNEPLKVPSETKLITMPHISNVIGVPNLTRPAQFAARAAGIPLLIDAAQSIGHMPVNVDELGADFLVFSGHKMLGLTGIGVLYIRESWQKHFQPVFTGGGIVEEVFSDRHRCHYRAVGLPNSLEAGTPPIIEAVALAAAIDYLDELGMDQIEEYISGLTRYCCDQLEQLGIEPLGPTNKHGLVSFNLDDIHPHDVAYELDRWDIAVRAGHHCAHLCHRHYGVHGSVRASFHVYNTFQDVDRLIAGLTRIREGDSLCTASKPTT